MTESFNDLDENGRRIAQEGDYRNELGRLYCGRCHAPKELLATDEEGNVVKTWPRECDCEMVRRQVSQAKERLRERRAKLPERYAHRFEESDGRSGRAEEVARRYADGFERARTMQINGVMFYGRMGRGKTFLASCIATKLAEQGKNVHVMSMAKLVADSMAHSFDRSEWIDDLLDCDLLVLDDFGVERATDTANETVFQVIDGIERCNVPVVVTTNLTPEQLSDTSDMSKARIYSRLSGRCYPVEVKGDKGRVSKDAAKEASEFYG